MLDVKRQLLVEASLMFNANGVSCAVSTPTCRESTNTLQWKLSKAALAADTNLHLLHDLIARIAWNL